MLLSVMILYSAEKSVEMNEMLVVKQAEFRPDQLVGKEHKDIMNRVCAGILIVTDLTGLTFQSNNGVVSVKHDPGRYMVFVSEGERVLDIYKEGFKPLEIILSEYGIYGLKSGQVYELQITSKIKESEGLGSFLLKSEPAGADIIVQGLPVFKGKTPYQFDNFRTGYYQISLKLDRYQGKDIKILIEKDKTSEQNIKLSPVWGDLLIETEPNNLEVWINNQMRGRSPLTFTGINNGLVAGKYSIVVKNPNEFFEPLSDTLTLDAERKIEKKYKLKDISGTIQVVATSQKFEVYLNDQIHRQLSENKEVRLKKGYYTIKTRVIGEDQTFFEPWLDHVELKASDRLIVTPDHQSNFAWLSVKADNEPYEVFLDDTYNASLSKKQKVKVSTGTHLIMVKKTGDRSDAFEPFITTITLLNKDDQTVNADLKALKANLGLHSNQKNTTFEIIDKHTGKSVKSNNSSIELLVGEYSVIARSAGFIDHQQAVKIVQGMDKKIDFSLRSYQGSMHEKKDFWSKNMYAGLALIAINGAAVYYSEMKADDYFDQYQQAQTSADALNLREKTNKWNDYRSLSILSISVPTTYTLFSFVKRSYYSYKSKKS